MNVKQSGKCLVLLAFVASSHVYEDSKDKHNDEQTKDITPDFIKMINEEFLGIKSNEL